MRTTTTRSDNSSNIFYNYYSSPSSSRCKIEDIQKKFLSCHVCKELYRQPKLLPCLHSFCLPCLNSYVPDHSLSLACPICRQHSILPVSGVSGLRDNNFVSELATQLRNFLGKEAYMQPFNPSETMAITCLQHEQVDVSHYCVDCDTIICGACIQVEHRDHTMKILNEFVVDEKVSLEKTLKKLINHSKPPTLALRNIEKTQDKLMKQTLQSEQTINEHYGHLIKALEHRREYLLAQLFKKSSEKKEILNFQKRSVENLKSTLDLFKESIESCLTLIDDPVKIILAKKELQDSLEQFFSTASSLPNQKENDKGDKTLEDEINELNIIPADLGVILCSSAVAHETTASGENLKKCHLNNPARVVVTTKNFKGVVVSNLGAKLSAKITYLNTSDSTAFKLDKKRPKSAQNTEMTLDVVQLEINLFGQPICNSPFTIKIKPELPGTSSKKSALNSNRLRETSFKTSPRPLHANRKPSSASASQHDGPCQRIGSKGHNKGEFMNLQGIAVHDERIAVADSNGQCVQIFSLEGDCLLKFGVKGRSPGQMQRPTSVTFTPDGQNILVSDYENKWIGIYTIEGKFLSRLGHGKLVGPKGVAIDAQGRVVVVDNKSSTVFLYTLSGKILGKFGLRAIDHESSGQPVVRNTYAEAQARMAGPHFCAIDPIDGDVVVTDFHNHKVKVFTSEGQYKFTFGSAGDGNGQFSAPTGVCIDSQGNILVADWGNSRVQIFDKNGSFLCFIDTSSDPLYGPQGIAMTKDNDIIVADSGNHCLKIYKQLL
ncbi:hypothetical protein HELRODRAFT_110232 [Helobdella robusta]|uniref:RING-type domain-containing protein n=1 Tax=Helobdella robusta TaxID=6412 RepID=T1EF07_HELRO|nr:hypothetical protein HELRODRAFT_110232 [Helobdella robusta]ESO07943.1 hypothetical protein HELRODRAFT_110232 [Helobdella robusta]